MELCAVGLLQPACLCMSDPYFQGNLSAADAAVFGLVSGGDRGSPFLIVSHFSCFLPSAYKARIPLKKVESAIPSTFLPSACKEHASIRKAGKALLFAFYPSGFQDLRRKGSAFRGGAKSKGTILSLGWLISCRFGCGCGCLPAVVDLYV